MNAHLYHIVGLSMLDAEDRYGSEDRYWRGGLDGGMTWDGLRYLHVMRCIICSLENQNVKGFCHEIICLSSWGM